MCCSVSDCLIRVSKSASPQVFRQRPMTERASRSVRPVAVSSGMALSNTALQKAAALNGTTVPVALATELSSLVSSVSSVTLRDIA